MRSSIGKSSVPGPDRETETTPHDVTRDLMTGKPTDRTGSGQAWGAGQGRVSSVAFPGPLNPGWAELARPTDLRIKVSRRFPSSLTFYRGFPYDSSRTPLVASPGAGMAVSLRNRVRSPVQN